MTESVTVRDSKRCAVAQHVNVINAVRASGHPRDQAACLQGRVHPARAGHADMLAGQIGQPCPLRQGHHRDQAGPRHEIRVIERRVWLHQIMRQSHLRGVSSTTVASATPIVAAPRYETVISGGHTTP